MLGRSWGRSRLRSVWAAAGVALLATMAAVTAVPAAAAAPVGWLHTEGSRIVDADGHDHVVKAVSWFGLETSNCAPHGLWSISLDQGLTQIASFGFNAIRLPFSNECLASTSRVTGVDLAKNPDLAGKTPLQVMDAVVAGAKTHGLSVILDRHRPDSGSQSALWSTDAWSESAWLADWRRLAERYRDDPTVVGVDLHNEPHGTACWGCGDRTRDWAAAAERAGNAVLAVNPRLLVVVEGVENTSAGATWWGGGLADAARRPVRLDVAGRLVYSPHDYPASIYGQPWFSAPDYPKNLPARWDSQWGYLQKQGVAPVLLGEFGTRLQTTSDQQWLATLVDYLRDNQMSFAYWSFNPNSGDTGGLVADDWVTPQTAKLTALAPLLGKAAPTAPPSSPPATSPPPTAPASPPPSTTAPTTTAPTAPGSRPPTTGPSAGAGLSATWHLQSAWDAGYVAELEVSATQARNGWSVSWSDPAARGVVNAWGLTCSVSGGRVSCRAVDWGANLAAGRTVRVGLQVDTPGPAPTAPRLTLA